MTSATDDLRLAADFAPATHDDWRKLVDGVLKGAPFEKLVGKTYDGLQDRSDLRARARAPRRSRAAPRPRPGRSCSGSIIPIRRRPMRRRCTISKTAPPGLTLVFAGANGAYGFGLEPSAETIDKVLDGVYLRCRHRASNFRSVRSRGWPAIHR